jgi:O-methyltransferase involved in polyketide biosynthesis
MLQDQAGGTEIEGVSATSLMTLYMRAREAARPNPIINDHLAIQLTKTIDYDFGRFKNPTQAFAVRSLVFDSAIKSFIRKHPGATVIALAEGLQTTFWRVSDSDVKWVSLDLPVIIDIRRRLLPQSPQVRSMSMSAFDTRWFEEFDRDAPVFISIEGLLQYFQPAESIGLITGIFTYFRNVTVIFDSIPRWVAKRSEKGKWPGSAAAAANGGPVPPLPFSFTKSDGKVLQKNLGDGVRVKNIGYVGGRGLAGVVLRLTSQLPLISRFAPTITLITTTA